MSAEEQSDTNTLPTDIIIATTAAAEGMETLKLDTTEKAYNNLVNDTFTLEAATGKAESATSVPAEDDNTTADVSRIDEGTEETNTTADDSLETSTVIIVDNSTDVSTSAEPGSDATNITEETASADDTSDQTTATDVVDTDSNTVTTAATETIADVTADVTSATVAGDIAENDTILITTTGTIKYYLNLAWIGLCTIMPLE